MTDQKPPGTGEGNAPATSTTPSPPVAASPQVASSSATSAASSAAAASPVAATPGAGPTPGKPAPPTATATATGPASPAAAPPPRPTAPAAVTPSRGGAGPVVVLAGLVLAALAAAPFWSPLLPYGPARGGADKGVADLAARLAALEARPAAPAGDPAGLAALRAALDGASQRLAQVEKRLAEAPSAGAAMAGAALAADLAPRLAALEKSVREAPGTDPTALQGLLKDSSQIAAGLAQLGDRLSRVETVAGQRAVADRADQMALLGVGQLREAMESGRPFTAELGAVRSLARDRADVLALLTPLDPVASAGLASPARLAQGLGGLAGAIVRAGEAAPGTAWTDQVLDSLRGLVTVRRVGAAAPAGSVEGDVAAAEQALAAGDVARAAAAIGALTGAPAETAKPWLAQARTRLDALGTVDRAAALLTQRLADAKAN